MSMKKLIKLSINYKNRKSMKKLVVLIASVLFVSVLNAQQSPVKISWTGELNCEYCQLDSVVVTNKTNGERVVFYYPDTVLLLGDVSVTPIELEAETSLKTYPNPFSDKVIAEFSLAQSGEVDISVCDMLGREVIRQRHLLERGTHRFELALPEGMYSLSLQTATRTQSVRLLSESRKNAAPQIAYAGMSPHPDPLQRRGSNSPFEGGRGLSESPSFGGNKGGLSQKSNDDLPFNYGDVLVLQGFIGDTNTFQYKITQEVTLTEDAHVIFAFLSIIERPEVTEIEFFPTDPGYHDCSYRCCYVPAPMIHYYSSNNGNDQEWIERTYWLLLVETTDSFLLITTQAQLDSIFACDSTFAPPAVDFEQQCLLLAKGTTPTRPSRIPPLSLIYLSDGHFILQTEMRLSGSYLWGAFNWMVLINKPLSKEQIRVRIIFY